MDNAGRRPLTLVSLFTVSLALGVIAICFWHAETTSQEMNTFPQEDFDCDSHKYCFDCVQDDSCGFCSYNGSYSCVKAFEDTYADDSTKYVANNGSCTADNFYGDYCPGQTNGRCFISIY